MTDKHQATRDLIGRMATANFHSSNMAKIIDNMFLVAMFKAGVPVELARKVFDELAGALTPDMPVLPTPWFGFFVE